MKIKLRIIIFTLAMLAVLAVFGSAPASSAASPIADEDLFGDNIDPMDRVRVSNDGTYRVGIDHFGNMVRLPMPEDINRVVATWNSSNQTMVMLGAKDKIVGTTVNISIAEWFKKIHPGISDVYIVNAEGSYNIEEIMMLEPDLIIASGMDDWETFTAAGFTAIALNNNNYDEMKQTATFLGDVLGPAHAAKAKEYSEYVDASVARVSAVGPTIPENEKVSVFHIRGNLITTMGSNTMVDSFITLSGAVNSMAEEISGSRNVTIEAVIAADPDIITVSNVTTDDIYGFVMSDPQWAAIKAVREGNVYKNPVGVYNWDRNACESVLQLLWFPTLCYPEYYRDIDMEAEVRWFYQNFYDYALTDEEVRDLLAGEGTPVW